MKKPIKLIYLFLIIGMVGFISSCNEEDDPDAPVITYADTGVTPHLTFGEQYNFSFGVVAEGGYRSHTLTSIHGTITEPSSTPGAGAQSFTITGSFTASDDQVGMDVVNLTVGDANGKSSQSTIYVYVTGP